MRRSTLKVIDLRARCKSYGLDSTGNKPNLLERVVRFSDKGLKH